MNPLRTIRTGLPALVLTLSFTAHANLSPAQLGYQSEVIERALNDSSVADSIAPDARAAAMEWLDRAQRNLEFGHLKTARSQLLEAGRLLYPMEPRSDLMLSTDKQQAWLRDIDQAMTTLLPVAREIAAEKGASPITLDATEFLQQNGREALADGQLAVADELYAKAYTGLQKEIVTLRSGDEMVIKQPSADTQAGWEDAERRFADWRFFADWMEQVADAMGTDAQLIRSGSEAADTLYQDAQALAQQSNWSDATRLMDSAYQVMEEHWRKAGVDI